MLRAGATVALAALACAASAAHGAYPGANGRIVYVESARGGQRSWGPILVSVRADGTAATRLTAGGTSFDPAWSPDGRRLAYVHSPLRGAGPGRPSTEIWVMNADGSGKRRLTRNRLFDGSPTWSPDGTRLLFTRGQLFVGRRTTPTSDLWVMNADGTGQRPLATTAGLELEPAWSPTGRRVAFLLAPATARGCDPSSCSLGRDRELWVADANGANRRGGGVGGDLVPSEPSWSPDGARLAVGTRLGIVVLDPEGTEVRLLGGGSDPAWAPDGTSVVVADRHGVSNFLGLQVLAVGGGSRALTRHPAPGAELLIDHLQPDWQPLRRR